MYNDNNLYIHIKELWKVTGCTTMDMVLEKKQTKHDKRILSKSIVENVSIDAICGRPYFLNNERANLLSFLRIHITLIRYALIFSHSNFLLAWCSYYHFSNSSFQRVNHLSDGNHCCCRSEIPLN